MPVSAATAVLPIHADSRADEPTRLPLARTKEMGDLMADGLEAGFSSA